MDIFDELETIDAAVFSGELLQDADERQQLKQYCERWLSAIEKQEKNEISENN